MGEGQFGGGNHVTALRSTRKGKSDSWLATWGKTWHPHINNDMVKNCLLSQEEVDTLRDIINLLKKASKYSNETGASTISTISTMYIHALNLLPDRSTMTTTIGKAVYDCLDTGIKSHLSLAPPVRPVEPKPKCTNDDTFSPVAASMLDEYNKQMEVFDITNRQLNTLLVAIYLDPNLINDKLWDDEYGGITVRSRAEEHLRAEVVKEINKIRKRSNLEERDMRQAAIGDVGRYVDEAKDVLFEHGNLYQGRPHDFWKKYKGLLPSLAEVARRFLCVQSTSRESERILSGVEYLTSDRRAHLGTNHLRDLLLSRSITSALQAIQEERGKTNKSAA